MDLSQDKELLIERAQTDEALLGQLFECLSGSSRRSRQLSAAILAQIALQNPSVFASHASEFVDALGRPEAQTRWEVLNCMSILCETQAQAFEDALEEAEDSLYDEESGIARLAAFRFYCAYGKGDVARSEQVWDYLCEAIRCYHGDEEFAAMLEYFLAFAKSEISDTVRAGIAQVMNFDAKSELGGMNKQAEIILAAVNGK